MRDSLYGQHTALIKPALIISTLTLFEKKVQKNTVNADKSL